MKNNPPKSGSPIQTLREYILAELRFYNFTSRGVENGEPEEIFASHIMAKVKVYIDSLNQPVTRFEVIDHTKPIEDGGGRTTILWDDSKEVKLDYQDDGRTLKVFIGQRRNIGEPDNEVSKMRRRR